MASVMASQFSENGKYFAHFSNDGKLKIWNTVLNSFEQEFTPNFHLTSPCTCLHFIQSDDVRNKEPSPKKKKRRESESNFCPNIALGTTSGILLIYSISKGGLECTINSETSQSVNCLSSVDNNIVYSGADQDIFVWNLHKRKLLNKWKGGNEKITSILAIANSNTILTASKTIKLWDVGTKEVLKNFTGHKSDVIFLHYVNSNGRGDAYFISGSQGDRLLSCWNLSESTNSKNAVVNFLMEDIVQNVSINISSDGSTNMAATVRSGVVHIYQHTLNGKCSKPSKPKTTIQVVSDTGQSKELVTPIRIIDAVFKDDVTLCIAHGSDLILTFENIVITTDKKHQCLIRKDPRTIVASKEDQASKLHTPVVNNDVHYLTSQTSTTLSRTKRKNDGQMEVPMEQRLENLSLNKLDGSSKVPKVDNVAQLLLQGLHSKDKNILKTALYRRDENVIKNTVKRLPITLLIPLVQELMHYIQGKTSSCQIGSLWLKHILLTHAGILMSNPELPDLLGPALGSIESRLSLATPRSKLKGRLDLLVSQISCSSTQEPNESEEPFLIFNDKDSSDSDTEEPQLDFHSDSDNEWEEESVQDEENVQEEENVQDEEIEENNVGSDGSDSSEENMSS